MEGGLLGVQEQEGLSEEREHWRVLQWREREDDQMVRMIPLPFCELRSVLPALSVEVLTIPAFDDPLCRRHFLFNHVHTMRRYSILKLVVTHLLRR